MRRATASVVVALLVALTPAGCGSDDDGAGAQATTTTAAAPTEITRKAFGETSPANAPGQVLHLQEVTIPPGQRLAEHYHQGTQLATIRAGVLTYDLVKGSVAITRADGSKEDAVAPTVVTLREGDTIVETRDVVHFGSNRSRHPVVITLAALLEAGAPMATPTG